MYCSPCSTNCKDQPQNVNHAGELNSELGCGPIGNRLTNEMKEHESDAIIVKYCAIY